MWKRQTGEYYLQDCKCMLIQERLGCTRGYKDVRKILVGKQLLRAQRNRFQKRHFRSDFAWLYSCKIPEGSELCNLLHTSFGQGVAVELEGGRFGDLVGCHE